MRNRRRRLTPLAVIVELHVVLSSFVFAFRVGTCVVCILSSNAPLVSPSRASTLPVSWLVPLLAGFTCDRFLISRRAPRFDPWISQIDELFESGHIFNVTFKKIIQIECKLQIHCEKCKKIKWWVKNPDAIMKLSIVVRVYMIVCIATRVEEFIDWEMIFRNIKAFFGDLPW